MNIQNHLISNQIHGTTPIKQGETAVALLKEKLSDSKAVVIIKGQEYQAEFTNEIPQSEKITVKAIKINENRILVESKSSNSSSINNSVQPIETDSGNTNTNINDPISSIMLKKGLLPDDVTIRHIKEALSGKLNQNITRLTKELIASIKDDVKLTDIIQKGLNSGSTDGQFNNENLLNEIKVEKKGVEKLGQAIFEAKQFQKLGRDQIGKERIIQALQQIENELNNLTTKNKNEVQTKETISRIRERIQQEPISKIIVKVEELLNKTISINPNFKLERVVQENNRDLKIGRDQLGKEKVIQTLQQLEHKSTTSELATKHSSETEQKQESLKNIQTISNEVKIKSEITKQEVVHWINMVQKQVKMGQALEILKSDIDKYLDSALINKMKESMERAVQHVEAKKELAARKEIHETLQQIKLTLPNATIENHDSLRIKEDLQSFVENLPMLTSASREIVVTKVTEKLAKATIDFKETQRELVRNLQNVDSMLRSQHSQPQAKQLLESTIAKLDNSILKSEMMILSDMGTEKKLMQASSQLAEAKKWILKGNLYEAQKIVQNVTNLLEKINWKPSEVKVMHYTNGLSDEQPVQHYEKQLTKTISHISNYTDMDHGSPREMYEKLRAMGLNYERDIGNYFASNKPEQQLKDIETNNLKYLLQKLSNEDGTGKLSQQIEQTLSNITGQQLLSKSDYQTNQQSMMFSLPIQLEQEMKNIKVFVNSNKDGQKVDWENCSLYFLIETPKLGEVGILVSASDRKLSLTLKNNSYDFENVARPIGEKAIQKIEEIGYRVNGMKFTNLRTEQLEQQGQTDATPENNFTNYFTDKGMNFTV